MTNAPSRPLLQVSDRADSVEPRRRRPHFVHSTTVGSERVVLDPPEGSVSSGPSLASLTRTHLCGRRGRLRPSHRANGPVSRERCPQRERSECENTRRGSKDAAFVVPRRLRRLVARQKVGLGYSAGVVSTSRPSSTAVVSETLSTSIAATPPTTVTTFFTA